MTSYFENLNDDLDKPPWTFDIASEKAKNLAKKLNVSIYLVPVMGGYFDNKVKWGLSRESQAEREEYAIARDEELRKLHPERYPPPLTPRQQERMELLELQDKLDAEAERLWEHDNPGLRKLYYPRRLPDGYVPDDDEE